jgi:L,D-transpeptidase YcbB
MSQWHGACTTIGVRIIITISTLCFLLVCNASCTTVTQPSREESSQLQAVVETNRVPRFVLTDRNSRKLWESTKQVYAVRQFRPAFFGNDRIHPNVDVVLQTLSNSTVEGLKADDFGLAELQNRRASLETADAAARNEFELQMTYGLARYVSQLCFGRVDPRGIDPEWPATQKVCDIPHLVNEALDQNTVAMLADQLAPRVPEYQALKTALQQYRDIAARGGWQPLPKESGKKRSKNAAPADATLLSQNLMILGDLEPTSNDQPVPDADRKEAITRFQSRHGLEATGVLNEKTVRAMNVPVEERIAQIETNLDRMRWIGDRLEPQHIRVNIPGFHLSVHDGDQVPLEMRVIVGSTENRTPVLDGNIEYLVFSPYWNIPVSIATKELLPKIKKDPNFLRKEGMEIVRVSGKGAQPVDPSRIDWDSIGDGYQIRQRPGASNALGLVKFIFPNPYNVYLHDTPADNLFDRLTRTLSHGCVRVEKPTALAAYLLKDQPEWTEEQIDAAMHAEKEKHVPLKTKMPIHLFYWTAWADSDGKVQFREDVYGYDKLHLGSVSSPIQAQLPGSNPSDVDVNKIGLGVVADAPRLQGESSLSKK